ncbi:hypothetical protein POM88_049388 [Heracleum sosnowskyi]|uniref:Uncharacterized protein n=1 Tax=Heracleum sosnowskyi TaxID=360622 RepID=A0AAD8M1I3_9APIA|nr:hypothetical protein POM88_049388 [Heracleum sosnowskyi]
MEEKAEDPPFLRFHRRQPKRSPEFTGVEQEDEKEEQQHNLLHDSKISDSSVALPIQPVEEAPLESLPVDKPVDMLCDNPLENTERVENGLKVDEDQNYKEDQTSKKSQKRRRKCNPAKSDHANYLNHNAL